MDPRNDRPSSPPSTVEDDRVAALVRAAVDDWHLPPQRLDQPTWRDRVGSGRPSRRRGWFGRLGGPGRRRGRGHGPGRLRGRLADRPADGTRDRRGVAEREHQPVAERVPHGQAERLTGRRAIGHADPVRAAGAAVDGPLPDPSRVLVRAGGAYRIADLTTGKLGDVVVGSYSGPTTVIARPDGGWLCVCGATAGRASGA